MKSSNTIPESKTKKKKSRVIRDIGFALELLIVVAVLGLFVYRYNNRNNLSQLPDELTSEVQTSNVQTSNVQTADAQNAAIQTEANQTVEPAPTETPVMEVVSFQAMPDPLDDPNSPASRAAALGLPTPPNININDWQYILVNGENTIDETFKPQIGTATSRTSSSEQDVRILEDMDAFVRNTEAQGLSVCLSSGYRSYETQSALFEVKCTEYDYETAATIVAIPGTSEHQTGLCCDITDIERSPKNAELENTDTYQWMSKHCQNYGFIVRYPKNKEDITKIIYEPWHFRYVGKEVAKYIMENDLCLEEFVALYV